MKIWEIVAPLKSFVKKNKLICGKINALHSPPVMAPTSSVLGLGSIVEQIRV